MISECTELKQGIGELDLKADTPAQPRRSATTSNKIAIRLNATAAASMLAAMGGAGAGGGWGREPLFSAR